MKNTTVTFKDFSIDAEHGIKILKCLKEHEPEIFKGLTNAITPHIEKIENADQQPQDGGISHDVSGCKDWLTGHLISHRYKTGHQEAMELAEDIYNTLKDGGALTGRFSVL